MLDVSANVRTCRWADANARAMTMSWVMVEGERAAERKAERREEGEVGGGGRGCLWGGLIEEIGCKVRGGAFAVELPVHHGALVVSARVLEPCFGCKVRGRVLWRCLAPGGGEHESAGG